MTLSDIKSEYHNDKIILEVINWVKNGEKPAKLDSSKCHQELFHYWKNFNLLSLNNEILYIKRHDPNGYSTDVIVVPYTLIQRVLYTYHNTIANCHSGVENSYQQCKKKFYFYNMRKEFDLWIAACITCNKTKQPRYFLKARLKNIIYSHFGQAIQLDHLEPSKTPTPRGNVALLTITDMFTSYLVAIPVKSMSTEVTIRKVIKHWITKFGVPNNIHHDLAKNFTSKLFKTILRVFNIKDLPGTSYHSQTQGKVESQNRRLNMCFRACLSDTELQNYDIYAKYVVMALNCLKSARTNYSANFLSFGREIITPRDLFITNDHRLEKLQAEDTTKPIQTHAYELYKRVRDITRCALDHTKRKAMHMSTVYDSGAHILKRVNTVFCL